VKQANVPEMACRVFRRFLKLDPDIVEEYTEFLGKHGQWNEAATLMAEALNRESFVSKRGKSKHQLWLELCDMCCKHAQQITGLKVEPIVRGALDYGNFSERSVVTTSSTLALFGLGLFAFSAYLYTIRAMYSRLDTRTPFLLNLLENTLNIVLAVALYPSLGVKGLALSWTISYSIAAIAAWGILDRRLGSLEGKRSATVMMRIVLSSALGAGAAWLILDYLDPGTPLAAIATVLLAGVVGGGIGIGGAAALGVPEIADLRATLTRSPSASDQ
jgi:hypothetical protein